MPRQPFAGRSLAGLVQVAAISPEAFGAAGDGVADDAVALQAAIDAARAVFGVVQLSSAKYRCVSPLQVATGQVTIRGRGWWTNVDAVYASGADYLNYRASPLDTSPANHLSGSVIQFESSSGFERDNTAGAGQLTLENLAIVGNPLAGLHTGLRLWESGYTQTMLAVVLRNLGIFRFDVGADLQLLCRSMVEQLTIRGCNTAIRARSDFGTQVVVSGYDLSSNGVEVDVSDGSVGLGTTTLDAATGAGADDVLTSYTVATLPSASLNPRLQVFVSDEAGGAQPATSDGTNWRRETDRAIVTALSDVLMLNGQSNAAAGPPVTFGYSAMVQHLGADVVGWNHTTQSFTPAVDGTASARANYAGGATAMPADKVWQVAAASPTFVDETADFNSATNADFQPFPTTEATGDYCAVGFASKTQRLQLDYANGTAGIGGAVVWEYWDGSTWRALTGVADETAGFTAVAADGRQVSWAVPSDWQPLSLNGSTQYYVRARVTAVYTTNPVLDQGFGGLSGTTGSGPGLGQVGTLLARRIATAKGATAASPIRNYALAYTSQGIDYFLPASATLAFFEDGSQHATLNNYNLLKSYVTASGVVPKLYVWIQGEANAGMSQADYYAKLKTLYDQTRIDYPGIRWVIVGTIGDENGRSIGTTSSVGTVFAAQKQLADENPTAILFVDNRDMSGNTAWWGGVAGNHYTAYAGYAEVAERIFAKLQGTTRPDVKAVDHTRDALAWSHYFGYRHSMGVNGRDVSWQSDTSAFTLTAGSSSTSPKQTSADANCATRTTVDFERDDSQRLTVAGVTGSATWTMFFVSKIETVTQTMTLATVKTAAEGSRVALRVVAAGLAPSLFYEGGGGAFTSPSPGASDTGVHTYGIVVDATNLVAKFYYDGAMTGSIAISGTVNPAPATIELGALSNTEHFDGQILLAAFASGIAATDAQMLLAHQGAEVEAGLFS